jgi:hypothetical protein
MQLDRIARCWCGGDHFLSLQVFDPDADTASLEFNLGYYVGARSQNWLARVRQAWAILLHGECLLNEFLVDVKTATKIRDAMDEFIDGDSE